jgi:hypothetical protein
LTDEYGKNPDRAEEKSKDWSMAAVDPGLSDCDEFYSALPSLSHPGRIFFPARDSFSKFTS